MNTIINNAMHTHIAERSARLADIAAELKTELFGIDPIIDRVIESLRAWYVMPELIKRPVIICLWGLTGTGKTQLTRLIAQKLNLYDRFVEVQMDGFSNSTGYRPNTISGMLAESGVIEGAPGILVLDEFQRYRTLDKDGDDVKVERYQDVWTLLSDGRLAPTLSFMSDMEYSLGRTQYDQEREKTDDKEVSKFKLHLSPYEARDLKQALKLQEPLLDIMRWTSDEIQARMQAFQNSPEAWETDYSKLLIFVAGNLDEMYRQTAARVEDCDTDADIFHALTQKLSLIDVKKALGKRFKPEQIARLGNNHVIYPSFSRATYQRLIANMCEGYVRDLEESSQLRFKIDPALQDEIYANAVFPAQGTRPLFSSIHAIVSAPLVNATLWAIENGATPADDLRLSLGADKRHLLAQFGSHSKTYPVSFELNRLKQRANLDFRALLAVHEAGHGLLYGVLFGHAPQEIKINVASFDGGYNSYTSLRSESRRNLLDAICVSLGGRAAEAMVFGDEACTTGSEQDLKQATADAAQFVRHYGFGGRLSRTDVAHERDEDLNTDVTPTNEAIEALLQTQYARATQLLQEHGTVFLRITQALTEDGEVPKQALAQWLGLSAAVEPSVLEPYAEHLAAFAQQRGALGQVVRRPHTQAYPAAPIPELALHASC
ncbi:AAA family ATPase [Rhodoferax sp. AJA081-3]|uniref:AAA family ATPase n=1 Tax=Rhodoferax sp. AJA081-3 TaxID=2752316 RepID=UPI001AE0DB24|nr:AAA family ATPase [Rhodoferax sp. AJA081-3]QTN29847.1 AAA family ATPase [Rhodoferax sp. AJA081-3]